MALFFTAVSHDSISIHCSLFQIRSKFTVDDYSHYLFTPRDLTNWVLGLLRYDVSVEDSSANQLLEVCAYEARRLFRDRLVGKKGVDKFDRYVICKMIDCHDVFDVFA
jgi:hypothetical protein